MHRITRTATRSLWKNSTRFLNTFLAVIGQRRGITSLLRQLWDFERPFPAGIEVLYNPPNAVVDIIFVHGLTGDRIKTWTAHGASEPWPKTLLPEKIPNARILTVGYDANVVGLFGAVSQNSIGNHAENLLSHVASKIDGKNNRPVFFVCHSLGGLVCQEALNQSARNPHSHLRDVLRLTQGIAFLGTPHSGASLATLATLSASPLGIFKLANVRILDSLKGDSEVLVEIRREFHNILRLRNEQQNGKAPRIEVTCFHEELPISSILPIRVVPAHLARIWGHTFIGIRANHINMAKFATAESPGFHSLCAELKRWIKKTSQPNGNPRERQGLEQATAVGPVSWGWGSDVPAQYPMGYSTQAISPPPEKTDPDLSSFSVAIFCAFAEEADAVEKQFDRHWDYERINSMIDHTDTNAYSFGRIGNHNVVLVHLGGKGKIPTAPAAKSCRNTFPNAKLFLVVGVCGAVNQNRGRRVALGDVIISKGVVEYDLNRQYDGYFELKDESKHRLHVDLEGTLDKFQTDQGRRTLEDTTAKHLDGNLKKKPPNNDGLSHSSPAVHIGWVASGNSVFKSKEKRDEIVRLYDQVIGFEMEGAAVWHQGRACLVVKGVSDHADIDKTKDWQPYAAAAAAACAKAILGYWKPRRQVLAGNSDANSKHQPQGPWFTVAYPENQHFTRRKTVDAKLDTMIREFAQQEKRKGYTRIALHGGPGVGKSQIVLDLAYGLHRNRPDISIFWVAAASREKFRQSFVSIANTCNIPGKDALRSVKKWLEKEHRRPWLMIVDNADNESLFYRTEQHSGNKSPVDSAAFEDVLNQERPLVSYIPNCPQGAIVFTTRFKGLGIRLTNNPNGSSCIPVERLDADESIRMLRAELGDIDAEEHELKDLANRLDNIPFAMIQATSFIKKNGIKSIGQFLQDLDGAGDDDLLTLLSEGVDTWGRDEDAPRSIVKMYLLSLREVRHRDRFAWDCLTLMSLFDREDIPREFVTIYSKRRLQKESTGLDVSRSLGVLMDFSLIRPDRLDEYDMHRLQQILTQRWLDKQGPETRRAFERDAILTMLEAFPISCYEKPNRPKYSRYLPHVRAVVGLEGTKSEEEKRAKVSLCVRAAMLLLYQRQWEGGAKFLEEAVPLRQEVMGEELGRYPAARSLAAMYELLIEEEKSGWKNKKYKDRSKSKAISGPEVLKKHMPEDMIARAAAETERE